MQGYTRAYVIRHLYARGGISQAKLATQFNVHPSTVWDILKGRTFQSPTLAEEQAARETWTFICREGRYENVR